MQLVAMGAQDVYLTGNPQITFFKVVYRRHTNFSKECIEQTFTGSVNATTESSVSCTLARNGDLVQEIYFRTKVSPTGTGSADVQYGATGAIEAAATANQINFGSLAKSGGGALAHNGTAIVHFDRDVYSVGTIPTDAGAHDTALADGTAVLSIKKNALYKITAGGATFPDATLREVNGEGIAIAGEDVQIAASAKLYTLDSDAAPVAANADLTANNNTLVIKSQIVGGVVKLNDDLTNIVKEVEVEIGGQKIDKHYSQWLDIYNELFETSHDLRNLMGQASEAADSTTVYIPLRFWFNRNPGLALPLIALQYHEVKVNMVLDPTRGHSEAVSLGDSTLLVNYLYLDTDERRRFAQVSHEYLIEQVQHTGVESESPIDMNFNHPVKALFWTQPYEAGSLRSVLGATKIQLNGHDRFSEQEHDYFHLVQPYEGGLGHSGKSLNTQTRTWGSLARTNFYNNVGMYSFCLKPAEHQPSGTCNFSRIDNARLSLAGAKKVYLFALNYNVLRIMSGMGGLAYSN